MHIRHTTKHTEKPKHPHPHPEQVPDTGYTLVLLGIAILLVVMISHVVRYKKGKHESEES